MQSTVFGEKTNVMHSQILRTYTSQTTHDTFYWASDKLRHNIVFFFSDPAASFCRAPLHPPEGSVTKPQCEINPFVPHPSTVRWATSLTESGQSPIHLQADWFSVAAQGLDGKLVFSAIMRAPSGSKEPHGKRY